jgi:ankyrin repeat protein
MLKTLMLSLLFAGAQMQAMIDIDGIGINKQALFFGACKKGNIELVQKLINAGVDVNARDNNGYPALMRAASFGHTEIAKLLIAAGADVNASDNNGNGITVLMCAVDYGRTEITQLLIAAGADVNYRNPRGSSVIDKYLSKMSYINIDRDKEILKFLFAAGCVNVKGHQGKTILMCSLPNGSLELVKMLIDGGANVNICDDFGNTALHYGWHNVEKCKILIDAGANIEITNNQGKTPFDIALENYDLKIIEIFQKHYQEKEAKKLAQTNEVEKSVVTVENSSNNSLNFLQKIEVPAHTKAVITTEISKI